MQTSTTRPSGPSTPQLEDLLLEYASRELFQAKSRWHDKQLSDDYAYTNGSKQAYEAPIEHWGRLCSFIADTYHLDAHPFDRWQPLSIAELFAIAASAELAADTATERLHQFEDDHRATLDTIHHDFYQWHLKQVKTAKRLANFYAYLCKLPHPFAGIDMLPADLG